ncbi:MAG: TonB-dependent receptor [Flavobacteriales bacterium]
MKNFKLLALFAFLLFQGVFAQTMKISGSVNDEESGEAIIYASVFVNGKPYGTTTNQYGYFSLILPSDTFQLTISNIGYAEKIVTVTPANFGTPIKIKITKQVATLNEVSVKRKRSSLEEIHKSNQMGTIKLPMKDLKNIPLIAGETDIIKIAQLLPGVQAGGEGQARMFVRGGDADQNLIILDEAVVYNISHLLGFFSVFNADAIKDITLLKGPFPASYGGRLSSVLDIRMNEGNMNKLNLTGGIGLLSSRLTVQAPLWKNKASFMIAGRRTYVDRVFKAVGVSLPYYFYDLNAKLNVKLGPKDHLYYSSYLGDDVLKLSADAENEGLFKFGFVLGNYTNTLRWNHVYRNNLFSNVSLINTNFSYNIS